MKSDGSNRILRTVKKDGKRWEGGDKERERDRETERQRDEREMCLERGGGEGGLRSFESCIFF